MPNRYLTMEKGYQNWSSEKLRRKADQAWEMGSLARIDGDTKDMNDRYEEARAYQTELAERAKC
jgi:hypothetical protein